MATTANDAAAQDPSSYLDRLAYAWRNNSFDVRGPYAELLTLSVASIKALLQAQLKHEQKIIAYDAEATEIRSAAAAVTECRSMAASLTESQRRIDFLWASQGLSSLSLQTPTPSFPGSTDPPQPVTCSVPQPTIDERLDAASEALRQSIRNQQLLTKVSGDASHDSSAWRAALESRLDATDQVIDGIFGVSRQLQTQVQHVAAQLEKLNRFMLSVENRVSLAARDLESLRGEKTLVKLQHELDGLRRVASQSNTSVSALEQRVEDLVKSSLPSVTKEIESLRRSIPTATDVKAMVAKNAADRDMQLRHAAATAEQFQADLAALAAARDTLFALIDVDQKEAATLYSNTPADARSQKGLRLILQGLPFRSVLSSLRELQSRVDIALKSTPVSEPTGAASASNVPHGHGHPPLTAVGGSRAPPPPLGLRLKDDPSGSGGVVVCDVLPGSLAAALGLMPGLRITAVDGRPVSSRRSFEEAWIAATAAHTASVKVAFFDATLGTAQTIDFPPRKV